MRETLSLGMVLVVAAVTRLYRLDLIWFARDQVRDLSAAAGIADGREFPLLGPGVSLTGGFLGPLYYYLLAPVFWFTRDPLAAAHLVALCGVAATAATYGFARSFFGRQVALRAAALFAAFPLAILSVRGIYNAGFLPLFTVLFMWSLFSLIVSRRSRSVIWLVPLFAVLVQLHLSAIALGGVAVAAIAVYRPAVRLRHVALGVGAGLLLLAPYLVFEATHGLANSRAMLRFVAADQGAAAPRPFLPVVWSVLALYPVVVESVFFPFRVSAAFLAGFWAIYRVEAVLVVAGIALCAYRLVRSPRPTAPPDQRRTAGLLLLWLAIPLFAFASKKTPIFHWYLDGLYPSQFILAALALASLRGPAGWPAWTRRGTRAVEAAALITLVLVQAGLTVLWLRDVGQRGEIVMRGMFDVARAAADPGATELPTVALLPLGYRTEIIRILRQDFGVFPERFTATVHGALASAVDENAYLLRRLTMSRRDNDMPAAEFRSAHYLVTADGPLGWSPDISALRRAGPYTIVQYRPAIDYGSWRYVLVGAAGARPHPEAAWKPLTMPSSDLRLYVGSGERLLAAGTLRATSSEPRQLGIVAIGSLPLSITGLRVNDRRLAPTRHREPFVLSSWAAEAVFEVNEALTPGNNALVFELAGPTQVMGIDIYEGGALH